jgi:surface protein
MKNLFSLKLIQSFAKPAMFVKSGGVQLMLLISMLLIFSSQQLSAQNAGFNSSFPVFSVNGSDASYCMFSNTPCGANGALDGANLGTFIRGTNTLRLRGAEHNVWKCGSADILGTFINYRVYPTGSPSGSFNERSIDFISSDGSFSNNNGCGGADQRWKDVQENIDLLGSLPSGNYTIEIYSRITTNLSFPGDRFLNNNNNSNNYRAYFTIADAGFNSSFAVFGINGSNSSYCMLSNTTCGSNGILNGATLGSFVHNSGNLILKGAEHNVFKCFTANITATALNYRVYPAGNASGSYTPVGIDFITGDGSFSNTNGCGGADQRWRDVQENINLTTLTPGNYTIEIYSELTTNGGARFLSNSGANYKANFTISPAPVDCVVSAWGEWSAWSTEACGAEATRTRTRTVVTPASNGGTACPVLEETETRTNAPCPVDCVVSAWGEWSAWSTEACGAEATRTRTRTVLTPAANGGAECGPLTETETRTNAPCPVDCVVSAWGEWSAWSTEACGAEATRTRTRTVVTPASNGGTACPVLEETETRTNAPCPVDCVVSAWGEWSAWSTEACGAEATRTRTRTVVTPASNGGTACPVLEETETRTNAPCPVDCVVSAWGEWSAWSTEACGAEATRTRTRTVVTPASNGGTACPVLEETETRTNAPCPVDCVVSAWGEWSAWSTEACGAEATRTRTRTVLTPAANGGAECGPLTETETRTNAACPGEFKTKWDLSKSGSGATQLSIGTATSGTVSYSWQELPSGASGSGTFSGATLAISGLPSGKTIRLSISPTNFQRININSGADRTRLIDVEQWGTTVWTGMQNAFFNCSNLNVTATDIPVLTSCTNMSNMFQGCSNLTGPANINSWNTTAVTAMTSMFFNASKFNQNIGGWNLSAVVGMVNMLKIPVWIVPTMHPRLLGGTQTNTLTIEHLVLLAEPMDRKPLQPEPI